MARPALLLALLLVASAGAFAVACRGGGGSANDSTPLTGAEPALAAAEATGTPAPPRPWPLFPPPDPALHVVLDAPDAADQGFETVIRGRVTSEAGTPPVRAVTLAFGEGGEARVPVDATGRFRAPYTYTRAGTFTVRVTAAAAGYQAGAGWDTVAVAPLRVLFVQGMQSESRCPDGGRFLTRAPAWIESYLVDGPLRDRLVLDASTFAYFSYSGDWCDGGDGANGAAPSYTGAQTCAGIERVFAARLRAQIDAMAPSKVTIVAHSMGGLLAAYVIGSDPAWAQARIASVVTFDSPLGGIDTLRTGVLSVASWGTDDCGASTRSVQDLREGSTVVTVAKTAGAWVPFYTIDGRGDETPLPGHHEAVPGDRARMAGETLHLATDDDHSTVWSDAGDDDTAKLPFVACAVLRAGPDCLADASQ